jgi:phage gp36-like protein
MSYCTQADVLTRISLKELIQVTDLDKTGILDTTRLNAVIDQASAEVDAYAAAGGWTTPITNTNLAKSLTISVTICKLVRGTNLMNKAREQDCKEVKDLLEAIAAGELAIDSETECDVIRNDLNTDLTTFRLRDW